MLDSSSQQNNTLVQSGRPNKNEGRNVNMPVELGSTMVFDTLAAFEAARDERYKSGTLYYGRYGNSASFALEQALCELENANQVTLTSSGVAAITTTLLALVEPGKHLLVADNVYGNTRAFCDGVLNRMQVEIEYFDPMIGKDIGAHIRPNTCAIMFETPGSGTFEFPDIQGIVHVAKRHNLPTVLDSTWATPIFCKPLDLGVDILVYSASKYISGHSDCMLGVIACSDLALSERVRKCVMAIGDKTGGQEIFLALRGLRTLKIRMLAIDAATREVASWLSDQPQVKTMLHPAFSSCPGHEFWQRDFSGAAGLFGVIFKQCSDDQVQKFVDGLHHFKIGVSWGGYESLVLPVKPVRTSSTWDETNQLVRFNIGLEDIESLKTDLASALPLLSI